MKIKIDISHLRKGMFVCELDRPWLESPFLFQGFRVNYDQELVKLKDICEYVYIDTEKGDDLDGNSPQSDTANKPLPPQQRVMREEISQRPYAASFEDEIKPAGLLREKATRYMSGVFEDVRAGKSISAVGTKQVVNNMVESILRNPDALLLLNSLSERGDQAIAHSINVCTLALAFGRYLGLNHTELTELGIGAMLHDIGETRIPEEVMYKKGLLSREENRLMQSHTMHGEDILKHSEGIPPSAIDIAKAHHERSNGQGYPAGLLEKDIGYFARIVGIVDVYDTVTTNYSDRESISSTEALKNMYNWRNEMFDAQLVEQFIQCLGIYPVGSIVELDSGEVGIVISAELGHRLQPKIMLVRNEMKKPYTPPRIIDLSQYTSDNRSKRYDISKVLEPGDYGIDLKSYLLREMPFDVSLAGATS